MLRNQVLTVAATARAAGAERAAAGGRAGTEREGERNAQPEGQGRSRAERDALHADRFLLPGSVKLRQARFGAWLPGQVC